MQNYIQFSILFIICSLLLVVIGSYISSVFELFGSSFNYVTTGSVGAVLTAIIGYVGWFLDVLFIKPSFSYTTTFGNVYVGSISWALTIFRVLFGLLVLVIILKLIIDRR